MHAELRVLCHLESIFFRAGVFNNISEKESTSGAISGRPREGTDWKQDPFSGPGLTCKWARRLRPVGRTWLLSYGAKPAPLGEGKSCKHMLSPLFYLYNTVSHRENYTYRNKSSWLIAEFCNGLLMPSL